MRIKTGTRAGAKKPMKKKSAFPFRKRVCRFCVDKTNEVDYKDMKRMEAFLNDKGKMNSTRLSGNCAKHQRRLKRAISKARFLALLPYTR